MPPGGDATHQRRATLPDYLFLMHGDTAPGGDGRDEDWGGYIAKLRASGHFVGGSAIGDGICVRKSGPAPQIGAHLTGFIRVTAGSLEEARGLLAGNPAFEAGGTVEIRELPRGG